MAGSGNTQIINGVPYTMYSPAWYDAMHAEALRTSTAQGTAQGSELKAASTAAGVPIGSSSSSSSSTTGTSSGSGGGSSLPPSIAGLTAAASGAVPSTPGDGGIAPRAQIAPVDTSAAEAATFNRAKDQVGETASGALTGLRSALGSRGLLGSGLEERGTAAAAVGAAKELGDVTRQSAITKANLDNQNATTNFQGQISQRGQDFQREEAANSLAGDLAKTTYEGQIQQRGQNIQAMNAAKALEIEQAQLSAQQRSTALAGLTAALRVTSDNGLMY
jgi:hypothetical protein